MPQEVAAQTRPLLVSHQAPPCAHPVTLAHNERIDDRPECQGAPDLSGAACTTSTNEPPDRGSTFAAQQPVPSARSRRSRPPSRELPGEPRHDQQYRRHYSSFLRGRGAAHRPAATFHGRHGAMRDAARPRRPAGGGRHRPACQRLEPDRHRILPHPLDPARPCTSWTRSAPTTQPWNDSSSSSGAAPTRRCTPSSPPGREPRSWPPPRCSIPWLPPDCGQNLWKDRTCGRPLSSIQTGFLAALRSRGDGEPPALRSVRVRIS